MRDLEELDLLIDSGTPLVFVQTRDSARAEELVQRLGQRNQRPVYRWSLATGLSRVGSAPIARGAALNPAQMLAQILALREPAVFVCRDLTGSLGDPVVVSHLREIALAHAQVARTVLLIGAEFTVPADLQDFSAQFELSLPAADELRKLVDEEAQTWGSKRGKRVQASQAAIDALVRHLAGLSHADARRLIRHAIHDDGVLDDADLPGVLDAKYKLLDQGGVLAFETSLTSMADVAGLENLKHWLAERREIFVSDVVVPGLDPPKGLLLLGVQGAGKSLAAKSVAGAWGLPLLRLDFATLYNKYYGETERNLRDSLKTAATMAPCVLWIDEIEKGLASEGDDGGPGRRILGTLLTWMAERREKVFLVATANDIQSLPPELLRKGRFDEIFFVDLPSPAVREAIFAIHLRKRGQDPAQFDLPALSATADGYSGAEIEQGVVAALYAARARGESLATAHVASSISGSKPLSVLMAERIAYLRAWARERTVPAD